MLNKARQAGLEQRHEGKLKTLGQKPGKAVQSPG